MAKINIAEKYKDDLPRLKKYVENSYKDFKENVKRYDEFRRFAFLESQSINEKAVNAELDRPDLEFNIVEASISRLRGEFSKYEPSVIVSLADGATIDNSMVHLIDGHLQYAINDVSNDGLEYDVYTDLLSGGFSVMEVGTKYNHEMSFQQIIYVKRTDPTLCGFDPLAETSHKGDGRYCFKIYPKTAEEAKELGIDLTGVKFTRNIGSFSWSYNSDLQDIILFCDLFEKKIRNTEIVQLVNGKVMTIDAYEKFVKEWNQQNITAQAPAILAKRTSPITTICRYRFVENQVIDYKETDFRYLPLVFVDGNSIEIRESEGSASKQVTRPYMYHAKGIQRLKNFAGQALANELENMVMHKFVVAVESIPEQAQSAYSNVQKADILMFHAFDPKNPTVALPPPREVVRPPIPPEITNTFKMADDLYQVILGNFDSRLGITEQELSGNAIIEGATQTNSAAMPFVVGYLRGLNRVSEIYVDLMPKYWVDKRRIPVVTSKGDHDYKTINEDPNNKFKYESTDLQVKVKAGVNFAIQKTKALGQIIALMRSSELFAQFMNTRGLPILLDNLEIKGIDELKKEAMSWLQEYQKQQAMAQKNAAQNNPIMAKMQTDMANIQQKAQASQTDAMVDMKKIELEEKKLISKVLESHSAEELEKMRAHTEILAHMFDAENKSRDQAHNHAHDIARFHHDVKQSEKEHKNAGD